MKVLACVVLAVLVALASAEEAQKDKRYVSGLGYGAIPAVGYTGYGYSGLGYAGVPAAGYAGLGYSAAAYPGYGYSGLGYGYPYGYSTY
ncbi:cuticle protein 6.4-like [Bacillus rossius redtenbacheri]|uniref:cuticle protein 6.4-like n=1 Tax=Bacillus rossius redtenbacheri TaxID=93214 RepID=UPI002FDE4F45